MKNNNKIVLNVIVGILIISIIWSIYYYINKDNSVSVNQNPDIKVTDNSEVAKDETIGWNLYSEKDYWFELKYPNDFFDLWHEPKTMTWDCDYQIFPDNCPNINNIATDLLNYNEWNNVSEKTIINNTPYCLYKVSDAATGHVYNNYYYTTVRNNKCFVIYMVTSSTNCDFYLPLEEWNAEQSKNYNNCITKNENQPKILNKIISTFKFSN